MISVVAVVVVGLIAGLQVWQTRGLLAVERARVNELLALLEAKAAPAEFAAYAYTPPPVKDEREWLVSDDGLVVLEAP